jgi:primosomal protein N' (replication factor Y)
VTVVRVLPNVTGLDKHFDYIVPDDDRERLTIGTQVRVPLHGRRVAGWVLGGSSDTARHGLKPITRITGHGPAPELVELADWAADRWAGRRRNFLAAASPPVAVPVLPGPNRTGRRPEPSSPASRALLADRGGVLRLPPTSDPLPAVLSAIGVGPTVVVVPGHDDARLMAARLRRAGLAVAVVPEQWAAAAGGVDVVVGTRTAAWAPCPGLAAAVVVDEHDEALQDEGSPTWHARDVLAERCRRAGVPLLLVSPVPTVTGLHQRTLVRPPPRRERDGWPIVHVVDRTGELPWRRSLVTSELVVQLRAPDRRVACVVNTIGRARVVACRTCRELARCATCGAAEALTDDRRLRCPQGHGDRPSVCAVCGATAFANLRPGVTRLREELEAAAARAVVQVTGATDELPAADVYVGTEALLHRVAAVDTVVFLDFDRELLAPRYRAAEQAMALLALAARRVGPRASGGRILVQTYLPEHEVIRAAVLADPGRVAEAEAERRALLGLPPFGALAEVSGTGSAEFLASLDGVEVGGGPDRHLVRAPSWDVLGPALRRGTRVAGSRLRVAVDPPRV